MSESKDTPEVQFDVMRVFLQNMLERLMLGEITPDQAGGEIAKAYPVGEVCRDLTESEFSDLSESSEGCMALVIIADLQRRSDDLDRALNVLRIAGPVLNLTGASLMADEASRLVEWYDLVGESPAFPKSTGGALSAEEIGVACANIGLDLDCAACAELFYSGSTAHRHTCEHSDPQMSALVKERDKALAWQGIAKVMMMQAMEIAGYDREEHAEAMSVVFPRATEMLKELETLRKRAAYLEQGILAAVRTTHSSECADFCCKVYDELIGDRGPDDRELSSNWWWVKREEDGRVRYECRCCDGIFYAGAEGFVLLPEMCPKCKYTPDSDEHREADVEEG